MLAQGPSMKRSKKPGRFGLFVALSALAACTRPASSDGFSMPYPHTPGASEGKLIAKVGPVAISADEVADRINRQSPFLRSRFTDRARKKEFAEQEVHFEVLAQEAWKRQLYRDERLVKELKKLMVARLVETEVEKRLAASIGETELRAAYAAASEEYHKPERVRLGRIVRFVKDEKERKNARAILEKAKTEIQAEEKKGNNAAFDQMAKKYTEDDATRDKGGDLDFKTREEIAADYGEEITKIVFDEAKVGDVLMVDTPDAVVLFRKSGRRRAVDRSFEQVKPQLLAQVQRERRNEAMKSFIGELMTAAGVRIDEAAIDAIEVDLSKPTEPIKTLPGTP